MSVIVGVVVVVVSAVVASALSLLFAVWMFAAARNFARRERKARPLRRVWPDADAAIGSLGELADVLDTYAADGVKVQCWERESPGLPPGLIRVVFEQGKQS